MNKSSKKYKLTLACEISINKIATYTSKNWGKKQRKTYIKKLFDKFEKLSNNPKLGKNRNEIHQNLYSFPVESHVIFYLIKKDYIVILDILHKNMEQVI